MKLILIICLSFSCLVFSENCKKHFADRDYLKWSTLHDMKLESYDISLPRGHKLKIDNQEYEVLKTLGAGYEGTVFLVKDKNKKKIRIKNV